MKELGKTEAMDVRGPTPTAAGTADAAATVAAAVDLESLCQKAFGRGNGTGDSIRKASSGGGSHDDLVAQGVCSFEKSTAIGSVGTKDIGNGWNRFGVKAFSGCGQGIFAWAAVVCELKLTHALWARADEIGNLGDLDARNGRLAIVSGSGTVHFKLNDTDAGRRS